MQREIPVESGGMVLERSWLDWEERVDVERAMYRGKSFVVVV